MENSSINRCPLNCFLSTHLEDPYKRLCVMQNMNYLQENYLYCEFLTNDIEYYDLRDGQQPTINLYSVPDDAYENQ